MSDGAVKLQHLPGCEHRQQATQVDGPLLADAKRGLLQQQGVVAGFRQTVQVFLPVQKGRQADHHADARGAKAVTPAEGLSEIAAQQGRGKGADVDAHVEDGKARIAPRIVRAVEAAHDGGDIRLEKSHADDDQRQGKIKCLQCACIAHHSVPDLARLFALQGHTQMTQRQ